MFVHKKIAKTFTEALVHQAKQMKIGDPYDTETTVGATIHEAHAQKVLSYIQSAKEEVKLNCCLVMF